MKNKKTFITILTFCIVVFLVVGVVFAALTMNTEYKRNVFTFGEVTIDLTEPEWDDNEPEEKLVYPNRSVDKDPQVTNTGTTNIYAYIEVQVPRAEVRTVTGDKTVNPKAWIDLFTYTINSTDWVLIDSNVSSDNLYTVNVYAYKKELLAPGATTSPLFTEVTFANILEGDITSGTNLTIPVNAYAIQSGYLNESGSTIAEKMTDAFEIYKRVKGA